MCNFRKIPLGYGIPALYGLGKPNPRHNWWEEGRDTNVKALASESRHGGSSSHPMPSAYRNTRIRPLSCGNPERTTRR